MSLHNAKDSLVDSLSFEDDERIARVDGASIDSPRRGQRDLSRSDLYSDFDDFEDESDSGSDDEQYEPAPAPQAQVSSERTPPSEEPAFDVWRILAERVRNHNTATTAAASAVLADLPSSVRATLIAALRTRNAERGAPEQRATVRKTACDELSRRVSAKCAAAVAAAAATAADRAALAARTHADAVAADRSAREVRVPNAVYARAAARNMVELGHDPFMHMHALKGELQEHEELPADVRRRHGLRELTARLGNEQNWSGEAQQRARAERRRGAARKINRDAEGGAAHRVAVRAVATTLRTEGTDGTPLEAWELELLAIDARANQLYSRIAGRYDEDGDGDERASLSASMSPPVAPLRATSPSLLREMARVFAGEGSLSVPFPRAQNPLRATGAARPFALKGSALGDARV